MNIVAINGSPTGLQGCTGRLLAALADGAREAGAAVTLFELGSLTVKPCTSCRTCQQIGTCVIKDDYPQIKAAMIAADGIVLASPNYISSVSAQMKALFDRCFSMFHCQAAEKYGACVVASGGPMCQNVEEYLMHVVGSSGCWKVGSVVTGAGCLMIPLRRRKCLKRRAILAKDLPRPSKRSSVFPSRRRSGSSAFEMMRWLVEEHKDKWPYEYEYWQTHWGKG